MRNEELKTYLVNKFQGEDLHEEGLLSPLESIIDYLLDVYVKPEEEIPVSFNKRKEAAIFRYIKHVGDEDILLHNRSHKVSTIITDILKYNSDRQFELYVSALEAATILLEVVRRPIDDNLEDEKWYSALKAKKQGFMDAKELIKNASEIAEDMIGVPESDIEEHVDETSFKSGAAERLAKIARDKKQKSKKN